jgi:hypothetical protein
MQSQFEFPAGQIQRSNGIDATAMESNPAWHALAACRPRPLNGATYSQMVAGVMVGEVLVARVVVYIHGRFHPRQKEIACWIANGNSYNALIHGSGAGNREIAGYYAIPTDRLLSLLFAEHT